MAGPTNRGNEGQQGRHDFGGQGQHGQGQQGQHGQGQQGQHSQGQQGGVTGVLETVRDSAQNLASNVGDQAQQAWDTTRRGVSQMSSQVSDTAEEAWTSVTSCMSRYPFATFFVGFGLGALLSLAIERNMRRY